MIDGSESDLGRRIASVLVALVAFGVPVGSPATFDVPATVEAAVWECSDPTTEAATNRNAAHVEHALLEIGTARALLQAPELRADAAFTDYVDTLERALRADNRARAATAPYGVPERPESLTTMLRLARLALANRVATLTAWLAVARVTLPDDVCYVAVPPRFQSRDEAPLFRDESPTADQIAAWVEFDALTTV